ncbi:hypothetical protein ACFQ58_14260 [Agromyces sp. NPDC056523]|uniref:hypothetical protein n=1 Tax=Agromyces sp. NPDC056523 TaxID=3345850 RepID=UPI0036727D8B
MIRPSPIQACAAERIGQRSPDVYTGAAARSSAVRLVAAQRAISNSGCRVASPLRHLAVAVLEPHGAGCIDQLPSERTVAGVERYTRELERAAQVDEVGFGDRHASRA